MTRVLLTGASGFLGGHLLRLSLEAGYSVRALVRRPADAAKLARLGVDPVVGELRDPASLTRALNPTPDWVFHLAASTATWTPQNAEQDAVNVEGTRHLLVAASKAKVRRFLHTSTVAVYGFTDRPIREDSPKLGASSWVNYARSKARAEALVQEAVAAGLDAVILNPTHLLGPGDARNWGRLFVLLAEGRLPGIPPGTGSFADVREVARAHLRAAERGRTGHNYLLGGAHASFLELLQIAAGQLGRPLPLGATPAWLLRGYARMVDLWSRLRRREPEVTPESVAFVCQHMHVELGKAERELDLGITPLPTLVADTLAWLRAEGAIGG